MISLILVIIAFNCLMFGLIFRWLSVPDEKGKPLKYGIYKIIPSDEPVLVKKFPSRRSAKLFKNVNREAPGSAYWQILKLQTPIASPPPPAPPKYGVYRIHPTGEMELVNKFDSKHDANKFIRRNQKGGEHFRCMRF